MSNLLITDDLAFSAFLRIKGFALVETKLSHKNAKFIFDIGSNDQTKLKVEFINSEYLSYYNEIRNLKKIVVSG